MPLEEDPRLIRDVTYCNGLFKFIELDHFFVADETYTKISKTMKDFDSNDIIDDLELINAVIEDEKPIIPDGWKIRTCYRYASWDYWLRGHAVHVDDFSVDDPRHPPLPRMRDALKSLRNLPIFYPTFGIHGDNVVYLMSKVKVEDDKTWIVGVDLGKKILKAFQPYSGRGGYVLPAVLPSTISYYLNTTPGCFPPTETNYSENAPTNAAIHGDSSIPDMGYNPLSCAGHVNVGQTIILRPLHPILTSSGSGYVHPTMKPVLNVDTHGKLWLSLPLGDLLSQLPGPGPELLNSLMAPQSMPPALTTMLSRNQRPEYLPFARVLPPVTVLNSGLRGGGQSRQ